MVERLKDNIQVWLRVAIMSSVAIWMIVFFLSGVTLGSDSELAVVLNTWVVVTVVAFVVVEYISMILLVNEYANDPNQVYDFISQMKTEFFFMFTPVAAVLLILALAGPSGSLAILAVIGLASGINWFFNAKQAML